MENFATLKLLISYCFPFRASLFGPLNPFTSITKSIEFVTLVVYANFLVLPKPIGKSAKLGVTVSPSPIIPAFGLYVNISVAPSAKIIPTLLLLLSLRFKFFPVFAFDTSNVFPSDVVTVFVGQQSAI